MSVKNTFIIISEDCPTVGGRVPPHEDGRPSEARLQYELLSQHPYEYDIEALNFTVHCLRYGKDPVRASKAEFLSRPQPCLRTSPLTQTYGWGVHYDWAGRIALYPANSIAYQRLMRDPALMLVRAACQSKASPQTTGLYPRPGQQALQSVA